MFNFFIQNRNKEMQSLAEIIAVDMAKLNLSRLAIEKAMLMIAKAIAKSDILIQTESKDKRRQEYRLNIQPNDHECGTAFWTEVVKQLLTEQEVLIIPLGGKYYRASAWESTTNVLTERTYSHITLTCGGYDYALLKSFRTSEVIQLKYDNAKIKLYLQNVVSQYDKTLDSTLDDVRKASPILKLVNMAPANVKKWIVASHSGAAVWGDLTDEIKGELSGTISALNIELHMLSAYLVIPKAIRELSMEFVDRYFMAILSEAMQDGLVKGYLDGDGKTGPIGIFRQIGTTNGDGTNKAKTVLNNITKFSPKGLANVRKTLTNNGKRVVTKLYLICNPADEAEYVDPCMFGEALTGGYVNKTFIDIEKIPDANCPQGKAAFTIDGYYTMGATGVRVTEYDQTKAMENADLIIANCFANGRAVDDDVAVIFDVTKLEEYVINVHQTSTASV